ncbi:ABC transporter permease [Streptomyces sp. WMMC500]|uniref:ABC transporter permease n=1 Tax=Streptomyces sp. WMMC500 TaxID=3015154 RepID=UPI00248BA4F7|nr:ABC transporter permease [Streptomyces sp. WMMC500]WBB63301.1 ABC transporter permease [Streptomyces sp. WMMC500]
MLRFLIRRTIGALIILLILSAVCFFLFFAVPRDPARISCGEKCTPENLELIRRSLGLDDPVWVQYGNFLAGIFTGRSFPTGECSAPCIGRSFVHDENVLSLIQDRFPTTLSLTIGAAVVFLVFGVGAGMIAAWRRGTPLDKVVSGSSLIIGSLQIYFIGPIALWALVYSSGLFGDPVYNPFTENPWQWAVGLIIPWAVLSTIFASNYTRMVRSTMIEQLQEEHVRTAKAKGMSGRTVFFRYAWRGAMVPVVTIFGIDLGSLLGGAIITEVTFSLPGIGQLSIDSVVKADLPVLMGILLFSSTMIILMNVIVDAAYAFIDPRIRLS